MRVHVLRRGRSSQNRRRGNAMIEAALILPLFLIFWFGIVDWGLAFWVHETVVHKANKAARWGVVNTFDVQKIKNVFLYDNPDGTGSGSVWFSLRNPNVDVSLADPAPPGETRYQRIVVTVSDYQWMHFTPFFAARYFGRPIRVSLPAEDLKNGY